MATTTSADTEAKGDIVCGAPIQDPSTGIQYKICHPAADLHAGDCYLRSTSTFTFSSTGDIGFSATVLSTDTNDEWQIRLEVSSAHGPLFNEPRAPGGWIYPPFHMADKNKDYLWTLHPGLWRFNKDLFTLIGPIQIVGKC